MTIYNLNTLAEALGLSYKALYNRIDQTTGKIVLGGKLIQARKERCVWLVWCDLANLPDATPPKVSARKSKRVQFFIDPTKAGKG